MALFTVSVQAQPYTPPVNGHSTVDLTSSTWKFLKADATNAQQTGFNDSAWTDVTLPHTWNATDGQDGGSNYYRGIGWYRRHYTAPANLAGKKVYIQFDGVNLLTDVYVNGTAAGAQHIGGHAGFVYDISTLITAGADNVIAVKVNNNTNAVAPLSGDWTMCGGIYRKVRLIVLDTLHVTPLDYGGPGVYLRATNVSAASADLRITTKVRNDYATSKSTTVRSNLVDAAGNLIGTFTTTQSVAAGADVSIVQNTTVLNPHLWNGVLDPYCYKVYVEVETGGVTADVVQQPLGFRFYSVSKANGFSLNGQPYSLHGAAMHEFRLNKGNAISDADRAEDMAFMLEMGCTFARYSHYQYAPYMYQLSDETGMVVWSEVPFVNSAGGGTGSAFLTNLQNQLTELIRQNYNHPSVLFWGLENEVPGGTAANQCVDALHTLAHAEDDTRLTTQASNYVDTTNSINWRADTHSFNEYWGWYNSTATQIGSVLDNIYNNAVATKPMGISEYGAGGSAITHTDADYTTAPQPNTVGAHPEEYQTYWHEVTWQQFRVRPYLWSTTIWNMFDFPVDTRNEGDTAGRNDKGMVTIDRQTKKDVFYYYKANWTSAPFVFITSKRYNPRPVNAIKVKVYSNCDSVELFVDGVSKGTSTGTVDHIFTWSVTLGGNSSTVTAVGTKNSINYNDAVTWTTPTVPVDLEIAINRPAGGVATLSAPGSLLLDANVTLDNAAAPDDVTRSWTQVSGPGTVIFSDSAADDTIAQFPAVGSYVLRLTASGEGATVTKDVAVTIGTGDITSNLMAAWAFDEGSGTTAADSSGNNRTATLLTGSGWTASGHTNNAITFNGTNGKASFTAVDTNQLTVSAWIYQIDAGNSAFPRIVAMPGYRFFVDANKLGLATEGGGLDSRSPVGAVSTGTWIHVAVTYDRTVNAQPKYYVNGVQTAAGTGGTATGGNTNAGTGYIGNLAAGNRAFNGRIDDMRIYTRILSAGEIGQLAGAAPGNTPPTVGISTNGTPQVGTPYNLNGSASDDGLPNALTTTWTLVSGPTAVAFANTSSASTTVTFSFEGTYRLRLTADDGSIATATDVVLSATNQTHYDDWRTQYFTTLQLADSNISGDQADPNGDGATNLIAYATGNSPLTSAPSGLPVVTIQSNHSQLVFQRDTLATDIVYQVQASNDLTNWTTIASNTPGSALTGSGASVSESGAGTLRQVTVTDNATADGQQRYLRLRVERQ
ncbi:MAG: glycoside hydrolase family 2 TIM barrel-domain containing protein [Chthoniobacterales bacterium]